MKGKPSNKLILLDSLSLMSDNQPGEDAVPKLEILQSNTYSRWFARLRDRMAKLRIAAYFDKAQAIGKLHGDYKAIGNSIVEVRFDFGPGYRVYLTQDGSTIILLLVGGDKTTQTRDIKKAKNLAREWRRDNENH